MFVSHVLKGSFLVCLICLISGCAMTAVNQKGEKVTLSGMGSGSAEFPDGTKIEKGLITFPDFTVKN